MVFSYSDIFVLIYTLQKFQNIKKIGIFVGEVGVQHTAIKPE